VSLKLPSWATTALGALAGVLAILNQTVFHAGSPWSAYITIALVFLAALGISPLVGEKFRSAVHVSPKVGIIVSAFLAALAVAMTTLSVSAGVKGVIQGVLVFFGALGYAPAVTYMLGRVSVPRYKGGRLSAVWPSGVKSFLEYTTKMVAAPKSFKATIKGALPIDGNATYGDCTIAGVAHLIQIFNWLFGKSDPVPSEKQIDATYFKLTGGQDTGLVEAFVLKTWQKVGLFGSKIKLYAPIKVTDDEAIRKAIAFYGAAYLGILCHESAQRQFAEHKPWTDEGEETEDGHCIAAIGFDEDGNLECATWGGVAIITPGFKKRYVTEAWVVVSDELVKAGRDPLGLNVALLEADIASA
jgi:hypothetical protein